jgi:cytochrome c oxidase subunit 2
MLWTVITAAIFIGLAVMGQRVWAQLHFQSAPAGSYQVEVVAQQFQWNFHYPGADGVFGHTDPSLIKDSELNFVGLDEKDPKAKDDSVVSALVIPVNRPTELLLRSKDVTHNLWVPPLRFKQDLVPGMTIRVHFTATKVGKYELACAELCGQLHYKMKSYLLVLPEDEHRHGATDRCLYADAFARQSPADVSRHRRPDLFLRSHCAWPALSLRESLCSIFKIQTASAPSLARFGYLPAVAVCVNGHQQEVNGKW